MIVVHAIWNHHEGQLRLWSESSSLPLTAGKQPGQRGRQAKRAAAHPFAVDADALKEALSEHTGALTLRKAEATTLALDLPSSAKGPLPSPELILDEEVEMEMAGFRTWEVPTLALRPAETMDALLALPDYAPREMAYGATLRYWITAARLAYELVARQCYMPTARIVPQPGARPVAKPSPATKVTRTATALKTHTTTASTASSAIRAAWEAVLAPEDAERVAALAKLMPPACWSFAPQEQRKASLPKELLRSFLNAGIDAYVRGSISAKELLPSDRYSRYRRNQDRPLPERWLLGLVADDLIVTAPPQELSQFATSMQRWLAQVRPGGHDAPFRTCFRLDAPTMEGQDGSGGLEGLDGQNGLGGQGGQKRTSGPTWHVGFYLQANDDRSLLVPADRVWKERSSTLTFLKRSFENPQERLLADLARASRLFPSIEQSLKTARPDGLKLDTEQAYRFLRESAPLLEQSGFGVLVPPWWQKPAARLGVKLRLKPKAGANTPSDLLGLDSLVAYDWTVSVGDMTLSAEEFEQLVNLKLPLIQVRGLWVELRPEEIEKAIAFFKKKHKDGAMSLGEALRTGLGEEASELGLPITDVEGEGWIRDLLDQLADGAKIATIDQPASLHGTLRPYQLKGVSWLAFLRRFGFGGCLADDMGLGKCLAASSLVTVNGTLQKAEDIWGKYASETSFDGEGYWAEPGEQLLSNSIDETSGQIVETSIKRLYRQHVSERLHKVWLEDGSSVTITRQHKLLTDKGWTNDLHIGDYVCVPAKLVWHGKSEDPDLVKFLAWQIAEGYEHRKTSNLMITQKDSSVLEELLNCLHRLRDRYGIKVNAPHIVIPDNGKSPYLRVTSVAYRHFLEAKGYEWGNLSKEKRIPDFIMQADLDTVRIFLQNYFEAEASVVQSMRSIEISTASSTMIQQLSTLLRRFGIWMRISTKQKCATNGSGIFRPYQFGIIGGNAARKFCQFIGFVSYRKQQKLEDICQKINNTNVEGIPASGIMVHVVATTGLPIRHFGMKTVYVTGTQEFSPTSLKQVITGVDSILSGEAELAYRQKPASKWTVQTLNAYANLDRSLLTTTRRKLQQLIDQEVFYCKIKAIEEVHYDGWVYDFEVEEHHNFVANNILCHNTVQLISLLLHDRESSAEQKQGEFAPTLLICPMSIVGNWHRELQRFAPSLKVMIHHGHERLSGEAFAEEARRHDMVITTYSLALRDKEHLNLLDWQYAVVDEAQNIKNESAKQTQAIRSLRAANRIALTGTPVENRLSELWSIMQFINPGYLGKAEDFRKRFAIPIERYHEPERAETLRHVIQPFVLRRLKTDRAIIADLPDKMEMKVYCNLTQEQASLYEAVVKDMLEQIEQSDGIQRKGLILSTLMKLKQVCNHPAQFVGDGSSLPGRSGKLARLEEMLEEALAAGDKALIFSQFAEMGGMLRHHLQESLGREVLFLHGGTPKKLRDSMVQRFQEERRGPPVFILSLKAGGVGLNLTAANHVFHFDRWWNPAVENQATDRAFRIGQRKDVQVHKFVCVGTLEERIDTMIERKKELAESIVGSGENWLTEMSTEQLKDLFALSREAVGE